MRHLIKYWDRDYFQLRINLHLLLCSAEMKKINLIITCVFVCICVFVGVWMFVLLCSV